MLLFFLLEKTIEKKHLKYQKNKGNKGMKISADNNKNANSFFHEIEKKSFVGLSKYMQVNKNDEIVHKSPVTECQMAFQLITSAHPIWLQRCPACDPP